MTKKNHLTKFPFKSMLGAFIALLAFACHKQLPKETLNNEQSTMSPLGVRSDLIVGINGHPLNTLAYNASGNIVAGVSYDTQAAMLEQMGMTYYRVDVSTNAAGRADNHTKMLDLIAKCALKNVKVLPMIYDRCRYAGTPLEAYNEAFAQMAGFATLYGQYFDYFELGNEWELFDDLKTNGDGRVASNYDTAMVAVAEQYVRGMEEGLKSVLPNAQSMVNTCGYFPTYWMDRMFAAAPSINICAWHIYADMPGAFVRNLGITNIHQYLYNRYQRPIWYTESNARAVDTFTQERNENRSNDWRIRLTDEVSTEPNVKALIFHELLDQPERFGGGYNYEEENFGFVKFVGYPGKTDMTAYALWQTDPNRYQTWAYKKQAIDSVKPDMIVTDITWSPATPDSGDVVTFSAVIKNQGDTATPGGIIHGVIFHLDGVRVGCNGSSTTSMAPGESRTLTAIACSPFTWPATYGTHTITATVDDLFRFSEKSESNNKKTESIVVNRPLPDMVVTDITWTPANPIAGSTVKFSAVVKNQGQAPTPAGIVNGISFRINGANVGCNGAHTAALAPGDSVILTAVACAPITWTAVSGTNVVTARTDDINRFPESNETNNLRTENIVIP